MADISFTNPFSSGVPDWLKDVGGAFSNIGKGFGLGKTPDTYDAQKYGDITRQQSAGAYDAAMRNMYSATGGPQYDQITAPKMSQPRDINAQQIAAPVAITADRIQASDLVAGQTASDLRSQQLSQAEAAANSPGSAEAQMRKAGAQIERQQAGVAATARGADRGSARRDLMQNIGTQGMEAAAATSALAAQEQAAKAQAYSAALGNIRSGDVNAAQAQTDVAGRNQAAGLTAQTNTAQLGLNAATANQGADLTAQQQNAANQMNQAQFGAGLNMTAQQQNAANALSAYGATNNAQLGYLNAATGATNAGTGANAVQSGYAQNQNAAQMKNNAAASNFASSLIGGAASILSDDRAKYDATAIAPVPSLGAPSAPVDFGDSGGGGMKGMSSMAGSLSSLAPMLSGMSDDDSKADVYSLAGKLKGQLGDTYRLSDEHAKQAADKMDGNDLADWAEGVDFGTFRYRPGFEDGGDVPHAGVPSAQDLEDTGPLGRIMVHRGPDGLRRVDYGATALGVGKGALARADQAYDIAQKALMAAYGGR